MSAPVDCPSPTRSDPSQEQLLYFVRIALLLGPPFMVFYGVSALLLRRLDFALMAGILVSVGLVTFLGARQLTLSGRLQAAALTSGYAVLAMASLFALILPTLYASYLVLCLLGVAIVLPYARGRPLLLYFFMVVAVMVLVVLIALLAPPTPPFPKALVGGLLFASITAPGGLICLLLWQYSTRMRQQLEHIQQSEQRFRSLAEATSQAVWITPPEQDPLERAAGQQSLTEERWGWFQGEALSWLKAIHPDDRANLLAAWRRALASREPYVCEFRLVHPTGSETPMLARSVPVLEASGQVGEWISACTDITERKAAEDALRFLIHAGTQLAASLEFGTTLQSAGQLAIARLSDWCLIDLLDEGGRWQLASLIHADSGTESASRALLEQQGGAGLPGASAPQQFGSRALTLSAGEAPPGMEPRRVALLRALGPGSLLQVPLVARGRPSGVLTLGRTFRSAPFNAQDAILVEELARRVAVALDNARLFQKSQEAIRARDDFLSIASHELRTPLTPLQIKLQLLHRRVGELSRSPEAAAWLEQNLAVIERQIRRLVRLIDEMLDISRLEEGRLRLELEPVELAALVREVVASSEAAGEVARSKGEVRLSLPEETIGRWDRLRMEQVIGNLLSNALKYGQGRPIEVEVRREALQARLVVRDQGLGITPEDQERVFGRFERAVSVRHFGGFGLGLYIARQAVEAMGGTIRLDSKPGEGSTFTVLLPLVGPAEAPR